MFQSQMTGPLTEKIITTGTCALPTLQESSIVHLSILEPVAAFLQKHGAHFKVAYPFT